MADSLAGLVLAAGAGTRLWPLTSRAPKALCPVGDRALLDHALGAVSAALGTPRAVAVNAHHHAASVVSHLEANWPGVHPEVEIPEALGTAGAVGNLRGWLDGRGVLVVNADTYHDADLGAFVGTWDGERVAVLSPGAAPFGPRSAVVASILPAASAAALGVEPSGLWEAVWRGESERGRLQAVHRDIRSTDCGTPSRYLGANLGWLGGSLRWIHADAVVTGSVTDSLVGAGAVVRGEVVRSVVWPGSTVHPREVLRDAVRAGDVTVVVR